MVLLIRTEKLEKTQIAHVGSLGVRKRKEDLSVEHSEMIKIYMALEHHCLIELSVVM